MSKLPWSQHQHIRTDSNVDVLLLLCIMCGKLDSFGTSLQNLIQKSQLDEKFPLVGGLINQRSSASLCGAVLKLVLGPLITNLAF